MIVVNLNSKIINEPSAYWQGFDEYCKGAQLEDMPTAEHRNGWWFACQCQGDTLDYEDNIADRQQWMRGAW